MMARTAAYYSGQEMSPETFGEFRETFKELAALHGIDAVEDAVRKLRLTSKFFPQAAEILELIEAANAAGRWNRQEAYFREQEAQQREEAKGGYVSMGEIVADLAEKKGMDLIQKSKPKAPGLPKCPGCGVELPVELLSAGAFSPADLRLMADLKERNHGDRTVTVNAQETVT